MTVVVTGASGFLGRALCAHLEAIDAGPVVRLGRVARDDTRACDLGNPAEVRAVLEQCAPDVVFHLAAAVTDDIDQSVRSNVLAAGNILEAVLHASPATTVVLAGSAAEYGPVLPSDNPIPEAHPLRPNSVYGWSKAAQTTLGEVYHRRHALRVLTARLFNLQGPNAPAHLFVGHVQRQIAQVRAGEAKVVTVGALDAQRDYLDVREACRMLVRVAQAGAPGEVYNVASGVPRSMRDVLADLLLDAGLDMNIVQERKDQRPGTSGSVPLVVADISKLRMLDAAHARA